MVITIAIPLRRAFGLEAYITDRHFNVIGKLMLAAGLVVTYSYGAEYLTAWYSGDEFERYMIANRALGEYAPAFWLMVLGNVGLLQLLWFERVRRSLPVLFALALAINIAMWLERYVIVITSTQRDFMPAVWDTVEFTAYDWALLFGSLGFFFFLICLFIRFLPVISIYEVRELIHDQRQEHAR
jgi:molybdopterin-containing oxidoreductase family membrane subunit